MGGTLVNGPTGSPAMDSVVAHLDGFLWSSCFMGYWVAPTWVLVVLPLTLLVPERSKFWHPLIVSPIGLVAGGMILVGSIAFIAGAPGEPQVKSLLPMAGIACAVGFLTALMLAYLFRKKREPNQTAQTTSGQRPSVSDL